jgi:hypothetical protein
MVLRCTSFRFSSTQASISSFPPLSFCPSHPFPLYQEPIPYRDMIGQCCEGLGYPKPSLRLPLLLMLLVAFLVQYATTLLYHVEDLLGKYAK